MSGAAVIISTTTDNDELARQMAKVSIEKGFAACAQIIPNVTSIYTWQGKLESSTEIIIQFKTRSNLARKLMDMIKTQHNYDTPEIIEIRIEKLDSDYEKWLIAATDKDLH